MSILQNIIINANKWDCGVFLYDILEFPLDKRYIVINKTIENKIVKITAMPYHRIDNAYFNKLCVLILKLFL